MEFSRQPRLTPEYPIGELDIESPPSLGEKPEISWFQTFIAPLVMICVTGFVFLSQSSGGGFMSSSMFMVSSLAMTGVALIGSIISLNTQMNKYSTQKKQRHKKYLGYIAEKESELKLAAEQQAKALRQLNPSPNECIERMNAIDPRLWERTPGFNDFLSFRLGIGTAKASLCVRDVRAPGVMETDPLAEEPRKLALKHEKVQDVPVCMDLRSAQICGLVGTKERTAATVNNILIQVAANHGYDNVRVFMMAQNETLKMWKWSRFLPHLWNDSLTARRIICGRDTAKLTLDEVYADLKERDKKGDDGVFSQYYIFIVESAEILEDATIRKYIYEPHGNIGVTAIFMAEHAALLPTNCGAIVTLREKTGEIIDRVKNEKNIFVPDTGKFNNLEVAAGKIAPLKIKSNIMSFSLPKSITLCQMLSENDLSRVNVLTNWQNRRPYNGMDVPIGVKAGGDLLCLDLHETGHGPHGLVAGTTGSGKSELLQSHIISLAINFHPHDVVFVLIDYKGGGMADVFKGLPHLAGVITNLGGGQTTRALLSIKSEIQRRQEVFSEFGVNNIDKYQKLYYRKDRPGGMRPVPHLVMIADEFAELRQDQPDFMKQLVSAARVGRSLGIHLILATQKPDGVVDDQIWSNSKFKMCLKVQTESDSNGVLKKPDAAYIREPGRAYIQVGNDEIYELFQSAYSGAEYVLDTADAEEKARKNMKIYRLSLDGRPAQIYPQLGGERKASDDRNPSQLETIVKHITMQAKKAGIIPLDGPWTEPLAEKIFLDDVLELSTGFDYENGFWRNQNSLQPVAVGIFDNPREQIQDKLFFDFVNDGNLFVYGMAGSGKTVFLQTLCFALAHNHTPQEVCIYVMDFGGGSFRRLEALPHIGGVMTVEEEYKINQFMIYVDRIIEERKKIFLEARVDGFAQFKEKQHAEGLQEEMSAIFILLDNYAALVEIYENTADKMVTLSREGFKYGIYLVFTAANERGSFRLAVNFKMAVVFEMTDKIDYASIVGRTDGLEPEQNVGRGLVRYKPPLEFQGANSCFSNKSMENVLDVYDSFVAAGRIKRAMPIPQMPDTIDIFGLNTPPSPPLVKVGLMSNNMQPAVWDSSINHLFLVTGESGSGKSTALMSIAKLLLSQGNTKAYVKDSASVGLYHLMNMNNVVNLDEIEDEHEFIAEITSLLDKRRAELTQCRKENGDIFALKESWPQIVFVVDDIVEFSEKASGSIPDLLERIAKKELGMKVLYLAAGNINDIGGSYDSTVKVFKNAQCGILFGSIKEQSIFNARLPFGSYEKTDFSMAEGYLIIKNKFAGIKAAMDLSLL
jgi:S-DNA-T family DNA segregation ATPase FtsK/SpoIIIE